jgi:metal-responsive CopG/Arc/MetJ family transcriptional regulator
MPKRKTKYGSVRIPEDLLEIVDKIVEKETEFGYRSRSELVIESVRRRVEELLTLSYKKDMIEKEKKYHEKEK